jgi:hypothetical protein
MRNSTERSEPFRRISAPSFDFMAKWISPGLTVRRMPYGKALFATREFPKGERLIVFSGPISTRFTPMALSVGKTRFLGAYDTARSKADCVNHSCDPTCYVRYPRGREPELVTLRALTPGDQITFNYLASDWDLHDHAFLCACGSPKCFGRIRGFRYLGRRDRLRLIGSGLAPYLRRELRRDQTPKSASR